MQPLFPFVLENFLLVASLTWLFLYLPTVNLTSPAKEPILLITTQSQQAAYVLFKNLSSVEEND